MKRAVVLLGPGVVLLAGCGGPDYATQCLSASPQPGTYIYPAGGNVPVVVPAEGGTMEGAEAINACIEERARADGRL